ncbi:MAG: hypothetical protein ABUT20_19000 [Bacteroidota bacterium]
MKKILFAAAAIYAVIVISFSCKKGSPIDCAAITAKISVAASAYAADQSSSNCKKYKSAIQDYVSSSCAKSLSDDEKKSFQDEIDGLTCP